jgi:para-nitrobenzyl esterase
MDSNLFRTFLLAAVAAAAVKGVIDLPEQSVSAVRTDSGPVQGVVDGTVESFKGLPFAQPPVGALRWRAPQPAKPWSEPFKATAYGHDCMQNPFPSDAAPLGTEPAEDCLVLNVWRPVAHASRLRPVIVWIYGGGFVNGGSSPAVYDGSAFAKAGLVFVSFNYRLGRFGFFAHPQLTAATPDGEALGNYGYLDQIAALQWVKRNIRAFGGDPSQVTVVGESAGGGSVHMLLSHPGAEGLFARAMVMSGGGRGSLMGRRLLKESSPGMPSAEEIGTNFAASVEIAADDPQALDKLRALPASQVVAGLNMATMRGTPGAPPTYAGPFVDGRIVNEDPDLLYAQGKFNRVDLMVGATSADIGFGFAKAKDEVLAPFGRLRAQATDAYDPQGMLTVAQLARETSMDALMVEPARHVARLFSRQGQKAWLYRFSYVADSMAREWKDGAPHATDIPYFFNTVAAKYGAALTQKDALASEAAFRALVAFAKDGRPGKDWPAYEASRDGLMDFAADGSAAWGTDPRKAKLDATAARAEAPSGQ